jgi:hypothetical protein
LSDVEAAGNLLHKHFPIKLTREEIDRMLEEREGRS